MPEDKHDHEPMSSTVKWLIGGVAAGIMAVGAFVGSWMRESSARDDKVREYLQQEVDKARLERMEYAKAFTAVADSNNKLATAIDGQTRVIGGKFDVLISDTRKGVWREAVQRPTRNRRNPNYSGSLVASRSTEPV